MVDKLVSTAIEEFFVAARADGAKPATIRWYRTRLNALAAAIGTYTLQEVDIAMMRQYVVALRAREMRFENAPQRRLLSGGLSLETLRGHIRALRRFWAWAIEEYQMDRNPMQRVKMPARPMHPPKAIALDDLRDLIAACSTSQTGTRDKAILCFLADTGCRAGGMLTLRLDDLDLRGLRAVVNEKGTGHAQFHSPSSLHWLSTSGCKSALSGQPPCSAPYSMTAMVKNLHLAVYT